MSLEAQPGEGIPTTTTDYLSRAITAAGVALVVLTIGGVLVFGSIVTPGGSRPLAELPWFQPMAQAAMVLSALATALLGLGRFRALGGPWAYWTGAVFLANGILDIFYLLSWPGLLGDRGLIAERSNTASWLFMITFSCLALLLPAVGARRPERPAPSRLLAGYLTVAVIAGTVGLLSVLFEGALPVLVVDGVFTPLTLAWEVVLAALLAVGAASIHRRYRRTQDTMLGYLALFMAVTAFGLIHGVLGGRRYDFWWYLGRFELIAAYLVVLFGLLQEGYTLFGRERLRLAERTRLLARLQGQAEELQAQHEEIQSQHEELRVHHEELVTKERELRQSEEKFALTFEKAPFAATLSTQPGGVLVDVNEAFVRTFGYSREEAVGKTTLELGIHTDAEGRARITAELRGRGSVRNLELTLRARAGEERAFSTYIDLVEIGGEQYVLSMTEDITERKQAEAERERLLESERQARVLAEEAVRDRDEFLSVAAHELKTPVTSLLGFTQVLLRQHEREGAVDPERLSRALGVFDQQSHKLSRLIAQLLDVSRLEGGRLALDRQRTDLVRLVENVANAARIRSTRHAIFIEAPPRAEALVDPLRIEQVVANLVDNAIRYSPEGGPVEIAAAAREGEVEIAVRDRGIGIPEEHRERIFDRFYRAHKGGSVAGLGLGLYISQQIVMLHGGRIEVECPPDGGARFLVVLPADGAAEDGDRGTGAGR
jgi:PAS domain S-box-containing protein